MKRIYLAALLSLILLALAPSAKAQTSTGQITGTVTDPTGAVMVGAKVTLIYDLTKQTRDFTTDQEGRFTFTGLIPGTYAIQVEHPGFSKYNRASINVGTQEHVGLGAFALSVGGVNDSVQVIAETAHVETDTSSHGISLSQAQVDATPSAGRNYLNLLGNLPGAVHTSTSDSRGWQAGGAPTINGGPGQLVVTLDGVVNADSGNPGTGGYMAPSPDAIAEVKVLTGAYTADYGARAGGQVNVTIKSGTNRFHGSAFWEWRHEELNANSFFNNKTTVTINGIPGQATPKSKYRYQDFGGTFGGPLIIPGTNFNKSRTKLFFFFSEDYLHNVGTQGPTRFNLPTALEKSGDFSQTYLNNATNTVIQIHDPNGNPYPGNRLPANLITPLGRAMLNLFPTGGNPGDFPYAVADPTGTHTYNSQFLWTNSEPREDRILRLDYNLGKRDSSYVRLIQDYYGSNGGRAGADANGTLGPSGSGWGQLTNNYSFSIPSEGFSVTEVHTFTPTVINEVSWGLNYAHQKVAPNSDSAGQAAYAALQLPALSAAAGGAKLPSLFNANVLNVIPNFSFGTNGAQSSITGIANAPTFGWDNRWPFEGTDSTQNLTDNLTWIKGGHTVKAGAYYEHTTRNVNVGPFSGNGGFYSTEGTYWFGSDSSNPYDTGLGYANLLTGAVQAYGEDNKRMINHAHEYQLEWFLTDNWKVTRRLTLDLGARFVRIGAEHSQGGVLNALVPSRYSTATMGQLLFPICKGGAPATGSCSTANRGAQQYGGVGTVYPFVRAGQFDPTTYANNNPFSGMTAFPDLYYADFPVHVAPRVGFAWDVFGNGKMAVRGGFGVFYERTGNVDTNGNLMTTAPTYFAPIYYNTNLASLGQTQGYFASQSAYTGPQSFPLPTVYDWNFDIQRELGKGVILDVGYVANVRHHGWSQNGYNANALPPLTDWTPTPGPNTIAAPAPTGGSGLQAGYLVKTFLDPTSASGGTGGFYTGNLPVAIAGKFPGYGAVNSVTSYGESNYNSLQVQLNKRFGRRFQFSWNYTWQKTLNNSAHNQWLPDELTKNVAGNAHAVNINFNYLIPDGSKLLPDGFWRNPLTKGVLDGWNFSGVGAYYTGGALTITCAIASAPIGYYTGTPTSAPGTRCQMVGPLWMPNGSTPTSAGSQAPTADPRLWYPFNASSFALPPVNSWGIGNTPPTLTYAPGFENWDLNIYKEFRMGKEQGRALQFKVTAFNFMNHFNPGNPNTSLTYNYNTGAQTNGNFGVITTQSGNPRRITLSLRLRF
jgi:Carboxypeptidase regulatory-like domain/TonB-dependent Receptor Plug Domain